MAVPRSASRREVPARFPSAGSDGLVSHATVTRRSMTGAEQALTNLERELKPFGWRFDAVVHNAVDSATRGAATRRHAI